MQKPASPPTRVLVRAAYPAVRAGLAALLREQGFEVLDDLDELSAGPLRPQVLVVDLATGERADDAAQAAEGALPVIVLLDRGAGVPRDLAAAGGWLPRDIEGRTLAAAVEAAAAGLLVIDPALRLDASAPTDATRDDEAHLTRREAEVLHHLAAGLTNKAIAHTLSISEHTAKSHVGAVLAKLGARSRAEAVTAAARRGLLTL